VSALLKTSMMSINFSSESPASCSGAGKSFSGPFSDQIPLKLTYTRENGKYTKRHIYLRIIKLNSTFVAKKIKV